MSQSGFSYSALSGASQRLQELLKKSRMSQSNLCPYLSKLLLLFRYLLVFLARIVCIVAFFAPFIGLWDILIHYQAETISLSPDIFKRLNETADQQYHYFNLFTNEFDNVHITSIFRSNYADPKNPLPPPTTIYTVITLLTAFVTFWLTYLAYGILLTILKCLFSEDFKSAGKWKKIQHILKGLEHARILFRLGR